VSLLQRLLMIPSNVVHCWQDAAQRTKATTAEATVMDRAVQGSWPRLTKKLVQTIAPRPLETISYCAQTSKTVQLNVKQSGCKGNVKAPSRRNKRGYGTAAGSIDRLDI